MVQAMDFPTLSGRSIFVTQESADLGAPPQTPEFSAWVPPAGGKGQDRAKGCSARSACRLAADWRSGRTPALPYPPAGMCIVIHRTHLVKINYPAGGTHALNSGGAGAEPLLQFRFASNSTGLM